MPIKVTDYLQLDKRTFNASGAFDTILDVDTKLYISPLLLHQIDTPELSSSYEHIQEHFGRILVLLRASKQSGDRAWREASRRLRFREPSWLPLGYSGSGTSGRGIGPHVQRQLTDAAKEIVDAGISEPEIFELIGLLEENVGPDLISDMIGNIILPDLLRYSVRVYNELGISTKKLDIYTYLDEKFSLPTYRTGKKGVPIVLVPRAILKPLPIMTTWDDIDDVAGKNDEVRRQMNLLIGEAWSKIATKDKKGALKKVLLSEPELFRNLIRDYRDAPPESYDFLEDPAGFVNWVEAARAYAERYPLSLEPRTVSSRGEVLEVVLKICYKFKQLIENNGLSKERSLGEMISTAELERWGREADRRCCKAAC